MSSKNAPEEAAARPARRSSWSLAARLTAWYAGSAFALVLLATVSLYWALTRSLDREDDQLLADKVSVLRDVLSDRKAEPSAIVREVVESWQGRQHTQVYARIIGPGGDLVAETPGMGEILPTTTFPPPSTGPVEGIDLDLDRGRSFRVVAVRLGDGPGARSPATVQLAMDRSHEEGILGDYRRNLWMVLGVALVICTAVGHRIARRGIRPIHEIADTARRIRPTNLAERIVADGLPAELLTLAETINGMLDRLEKSFARLGRFSADIAHELRTPVNILRGEVEVALGKPRTAEEYREVLGSNLEECGRLSRIIDSLLFLARAENPEMQITRERFDVGRELAAVCDFYEAAASEKGVRLAVSAGDQVTADLNRHLFQRAVGNVVANALAYTAPGGTVTLSATDDGTAAKVEVLDDGCGIPASHLPHVFDRFYRADQARSAEVSGVGLGLAIVRSIAELHGGDVGIASEVGHWTRVVMTFPRRTEAEPAKMTKP